MEKDCIIDSLSAGKDLKEKTAGRVSMAFRSLLFAIWGILLLFIALNPTGLFMMLYVLAIPAWAMGCAGLYYGTRSLAGRQGPRPVAIIGIVLNALIVLLPSCPFVVAYYPGITRAQTAGLLVDCRHERRGALWKARFHGDAILGPLKDSTDNFDINCPRAADNILEVLSFNRSQSSRALLGELAWRGNPYQRMIGTAGLVSHGVYSEDIDEGSYLVRTVRGYDPDTVYVSWQVLRAVRALGDIGDKGALPAVASLFLKQKVFYKILVEACGTLAKLGDRRAIPVLREYLKGPRDDAAADVFRCLISLGDSRAVPIAIGRIGRLKKPGREDQDVVGQLEVVTGKKFGDCRAAWEAWWLSAEASWQIPAKYVSPRNEGEK